MKIEKIELTKQDWINARDQAAAEKKQGLVLMTTGQILEDKAKEEIKKFPAEKKKQEPPAGTG